MFRSRRPFLPYALQEIDDEDRKAVSEAMKGDFVTRGPNVEAFEKAFAEEVDAPFAVAFSSGSTALWASALVLGLTKKDRLVTTPNTFVATAGSFTREGAMLELADIEVETGNVDLEKMLQFDKWERTGGRSIYVPVHFTGTPFDVKGFDNRLTDPDSLIIEDAAHAIGSCYPDGKKVGCCHVSEMTIFSFHPAKTITTGEGGMVTTYSEERYEQLKRVRNNGIERKNDLYPGYYISHQLTSNMNMNEMQAALGLSQLKKLPRFKTKRVQLLKHYHKLLENIPYVKPLKMTEGTIPHLAVVLIDYEKVGKTRKKVMDRLLEKQIGAQVHYPPMYNHPDYQYIGPLEGEEKYFSQALTLPLFTQMDEEDVSYVVASLKAIIT